MLRIRYQGRTDSLAGWARKSGIAHGTLAGRLRLGWPIAKVLSTPPVLRDAPVEQDNIDLFDDVRAGESTARVLAERYGVCRRTIERARARMRAAGVRVRTPVELEL